ncbi:MAG: DUF5682 family protein, partial [Myxococcota bacterium]
PAWASGFGARENRYSDGETHERAYVRALAERLGIEGMDALWDHLFEQPEESPSLSEKLSTYFHCLREDTSLEPGREPYMARWVRWAQAAAGDQGSVLVVCGGWHAPALEQAAREPGSEAADEPAVPVPPDDARFGSYLVPYTFHRLDAFTGYEAGMPSPSFYQEIWEHGPIDGPERSLEQAIRHLRHRKQSVSAADLVGVWSMVRGLMRLRAHAAPSRVDLLDGIAAALLKEAQEQRFPWAGRGVIAAGTDPTLVAVLQALSGERRGVLAKGTPEPPLVSDVARTLRHLDLDATQQLSLVLTEPRDRERSRVLHRLRVLSVPGYERHAGPAFATDGRLEERWSIRDHLDARPALIEASAFGATLPAAVTAKLLKRAVEAEGAADALVAVLSDALFVGLDDVSGRLLTSIGEALSTESRFATLGNALGQLLSLYRHDVLFEARGDRRLGKIIEAGSERALWLLEGIGGPDQPADPAEVRALIALRDIYKHGRHLALDRTRADAVMARCMMAKDTPPAIRGGALGFLWSVSGDDLGSQAIDAIRAASLPKHVGDFLTGLFALAREEVRSSPRVVETIDEVIQSMGREEFLHALPALRLAFSFFPPRERASIAELIARIHGGAARELTRALPTDVETLKRAALLEVELDRLEAEHGFREGT